MPSIRSAKNKAVRHQNNIRDKILELFPELDLEDVRCAIMGQNGEDIILSKKASELFPYSIEAKALARGFSPIYNAHDQASGNCEGKTPLVIFKQDRKQPMVAMTLEDFMELINAR